MIEDLVEDVQTAPIIIDNNQEVAFENNSVASLSQSVEINNDNDVTPPQEAGDGVAVIDGNKPQSKIPVASKSPSAIKVKTIKKHSKVKRDLNVKDVQPRPTVDEIEWDIVEGDEKRDDQREVDDIDDEPLNEHDVIKEISTLALEDVHQMSSNDQSDPIVLISSGDSYSGDIDEFFLIETPNNFHPPPHRHRRDNDDNNGADDDYESRDSRTITTKTTREYGPDGQEKVTIVREETGPEGEIIVTEETYTGGIGSESDDDGHASPADVQFIKQSSYEQTPRQLSKTLGSSSGSDVALHEAGENSSEDETGTV